jgi:uncharacterized protein YcbK (DUF882 family)
MGNITKNFSFSEFEHSDTAIREGIENKIPSAEVGGAIRSLTVKVLQPLRDDLGATVIVESGYRCKELNALVGGVETSQHRKGEAADIRSPFFVPLHIARRIVALKLPFDQLILYPTFVHVSHRRKGRQRGQVLYNYRYTGEKI